jgi:hypothetical protein
MRVKYEKELKEGARSPADVADRIVVEELDMERVALDRTLGRLWRAWKKKIRSPGPMSENGPSRPHTRESMRGINGQHLRQTSFNFNEHGVPPTVPEPESEQNAGSEETTPTEETPSEEPIEEYILAASIPIPMTENDVNEIEIPGLVSYTDDDESARLAVAETTQLRPKSLMILPHAVPADLPTPTSQPHTPVVATRKRSNSLPTPTVTPYSSPPKRPAVDAITVTLVSDGQAEQPVTSEISTEEIPQVTETLAEASALPLAVANPASTTKSLGVDATGSSHKRNLSAESAIISSAAAVELTAVAGLNAAVQAEPDELDYGEEDVEDFEEPQVLTSSRISISGRSTSPATSEHRRPSPINPNLPVRSLSVHSLRLVDVTSPRSPSVRSRGSSVDATELIRSANLSRTNSASTTPIVEEYRTALESAPNVRGSAMLATESISEAEELDADDASPMTPTDVQEENSATPLAKPRSPSRYEQLQSDVKASQPIFGSAVRHQSPPTSPARQTPTATRVTILSSPSSPGTFFIDDSKPEVPEKSPVESRGYAPVNIPGVPERSPGRQATEGGKSATSPAGTIGIVSVESRARSTSEARQLHTSGSSTSSSNNKLKAVRTPEESPVATRADVARNFEELIQSDQTIQYTLTPESMRDDVSILFSRAQTSPPADKMQ